MVEEAYDVAEEDEWNAEQDEDGTYYADYEPEETYDLEEDYTEDTYYTHDPEETEFGDEFLEEVEQHYEDAYMPPTWTLVARWRT